MTGSTALLSQKLQAVNQFVSARAKQYKGFEELNQELAKIAIPSNARQLNLQIFSQFSLLSEGLKNLFSSHQGLRQFYSAKILELPVNTTASPANQLPILILKGNSVVEQLKAQYELSPAQRILIGRDLQHQNDTRLVNIPLPMYKKISGRHAEIQPVPSLNSSSSTWQICDLGSTNGTYVNGQKVKGCQVLKSGDTITLAYPVVCEKSPEFIFKGQSVNSAQESSSSQLDGDLIFLVINPKQALSDAEKQLVAQISKAQVVGFIIVGDVSGLGQQDNSQINANFAAIGSWLQGQYPQLAEKLEITSLLLHPFYPNISPSPLALEIQQQLNQFCEPLLILAQTQRDAILCKRISNQLQLQLQCVEQVLNDYEESLNAEMRRTEAILQGHTLDHWRDQCIRVAKRASEEREEFFREARTELSRSKIDFESDFIPNNIVQKLDSYIKSLNPVVSKIGGQVCIQLQTDNKVDLHQAILQYCQAELTQWGNQKWQHICYTLYSEGLDGLLRRSYTLLNCLPGFQLTNTFNQPLVKLNFYNNFNTSFTEVKSDIAFSESSGEAFGGIAKIAMLSATTALGIAMGSPYALIQGASAVSALTGYIGSSLSRTQQQQLHLEQVIDSLRRNTSLHYQKVARYSLARVSQEINSAIDTAERRFRKSLEGVDEQYRGYFTEMKTVSDSYRVRQQMIHQDRQTFEQIKRIGV
jgi:hypothetical protein